MNQKPMDFLTWQKCFSTEQACLEAIAQHRLRVSELRARPSLGSATSASAQVPLLRSSDFTHGGDDLRKHMAADDSVVGGDRSDDLRQRGTVSGTVA